MLNPIHLRTLRECVRTGSFAEAGRVLGYTASAVSQQMVLLERAVGAPLFERSARSARSTNLAVWLAERSSDALAVLDTLDREVRSMVMGDEGTLRLASFATANSRIMPDVLSSVVARRPHAEVQLDEGDPEEVIDDVLTGTVDAAVVFEYDLDPRQWPSELSVEELMAEPLRLALPSGHPKAGTEVLSLRELSSDAWVCTRQDTAGARSLVRLAAESGFVPRIFFRSNDYSVLRELVSRGLGVAVLPGLAIVEDDLRIVRIAEWQPTRRVKVVYRGQNTNPLLPVVLECLSTSCAALAQGFHVDHDASPSRAEELR